MTPALVSHRALAAARGRDITVTRGGVSEGFRAVVGSTAFESGESTVHLTTDFIVEASAWAEAFGGEPEIDDYIDWGERHFEVRSPAQDKPFRYSDSDRSVLRVYTTEVA